MAITQVNLRLDEDLLAQIDVARGDVPRNTWIIRAIEARIGATVAEAQSATTRQATQRKRAR